MEASPPARSGERMAVVIVTPLCPRKSTSSVDLARRNSARSEGCDTWFVDIEWAKAELNTFLELTELYRAPDPPGVVNFTARLSNRGKQADIVASAQVVEQILGRTVPHWKEELPSERNEKVNRWCQHIEAARRALVVLDRQQEVNEKLGDNAPRLSAGQFHPWVWEAARDLWRNGHYRSAISSAALRVNAETQAKVGRMDVSEVKLFQPTFSSDPAKPGNPRLRVWPDDGSDTYKSIHRGVSAFAEGLFAGIRNPNSHAVQGELDETVALEQLAAFSVLARWVDDATVER